MQTTSQYDGQPRPAPTVVRLIERLEANQRLDPVVRLVLPLADALVRSPARRDALRGRWLGHTLHPVLTDLPIGFWTSAVVLDLVGGRRASDAATRMVGLGLVCAVPTAVTGLAEWAGTGQREQRVGVAHANANTVALTLFTTSWLARRKGQHGRGVALALAGSAAVTAGGYLGGHLVSVRKVSSSNPAFEDRPDPEI
jgi:uncharacterized membrane protein